MGPFGIRVAFFGAISIGRIIYGDPTLFRSNFVRDYCSENLSARFVQIRHQRKRGRRIWERLKL